MGAGRASAESRDIAGRLEHFFWVIRNQRTGQPYTNAEVARLSAGDLTEEEVEGIRTGCIPDPSVSQVAALADVFGVPSSWFLRREEKPLLRDEDPDLSVDPTPIRSVTSDNHGKSRYFGSLKDLNWLPRAEGL